LLIYNTRNQNSSWYLVAIENDQVKAKISHVVRGKLKILEDDESGKYSNIEVNASDVLHCREQNST
jgi:hypothetical protein